MSYILYVIHYDSPITGRNTNLQSDQLSDGLIVQMVEQVHCKLYGHRFRHNYERGL